MKLAFFLMFLGLGFYSADIVSIEIEQQNPVVAVIFSLVLIICLCGAYSFAKQIIKEIFGY